jgi:hypothetical protein
VNQFDVLLPPSVISNPPDEVGMARNLSVLILRHYLLMLCASQFRHFCSSILYRNRARLLFRLHRDRMTNHTQPVTNLTPSIEPNTLLIKAFCISKQKKGKSWPNGKMKE